MKGPLFNFLQNHRVRAASVAGLASLMWASGIVVAGSLQLPEAVHVVSGEVLQLNVDVKDGSGDYDYKLLNAPSGASVELTPSGAELVWLTPSSLPVSTVLIVSAVNRLNPSEKHSARLTVLRDESSQAGTSSSATKKTDDSLQARTTSNKTKMFDVSSMADATKNTTQTLNEPPVFPALPVQTLTVGHRYQLWMKATDPDSESPTIHVAGLPDGASFETNPTGGYTFRWAPDPTQVGTHGLIFVAVDSADERVQVERTLYFRVSDSTIAQDVKVPAASILASVSREGTQSQQRIDLEAMPTQIMGVGQLVKFPVIPIVAEGVDPILQMDRLPKGASFDVNPVGVRNFRWQTSDADEGEHVFRVSIFDKNNPANKAHKDVTIIIGDPTVRSSLPKDLPQQAGPSIDAPELLAVKVGQSVQFRVATADTEGRVPDIIMSQSPVGAVLQLHPDGSRLFHWQPNASQQGEHVVSFVAKIGGDSGKQTHRDVLLRVTP